MMDEVPKDRLLVQLRPCGLRGSGSGRRWQVSCWRLRRDRTGHRRCGTPAVASGSAGRVRPGPTGPGWPVWAGGGLTSRARRGRRGAGSRAAGLGPGTPPAGRRGRPRRQVAARQRPFQGPGGPGRQPHLGVGVELLELVDQVADGERDRLRHGCSVSACLDEDGMPGCPGSGCGSLVGRRPERGWSWFDAGGRPTRRLGLRRRMRTAGRLMGRAASGCGMPACCGVSGCRSVPSAGR